jgi:hypothetical protein
MIQQFSKHQNIFRTNKILGEDEYMIADRAYGID